MAKETKDTKAKKEAKEPAKEKAEKKEKVAEEAKVENDDKATIEKLTKQLDETKDMLLRTAAEFDNYKRRESAAKEKLSEFVKGETLKQIIPAIDNINRALSADENSDDYAKGVTLTIKSLIDSLEKMGLEEINPQGEEFDVNFHQAVMKVEDETVGENIITQVLQTGYKLGDNVLRHAMVKVANCD